MADRVHGLGAERPGADLLEIEIVIPGHESGATFDVYETKSHGELPPRLFMIL
jgi:hypothetical protein